MLQPFRTDFNRRFTPEKYDELRRQLNRKTRTTIDFRICETPCFFSRSTMEELAGIGTELTHQLLDDPTYLQASNQAIPERYRIPDTSLHPNFMTVDFGFIRQSDGSLSPRLVELQAFPSLFGYQPVLAEQYIETFDLDPDLTPFLSDHTESSYWSSLKEIILGKHAPENVVLLEIEPQTQKTLPDFHVHEDRLGIHTVDIASLNVRNKLLYYQLDGAKIPIYRIYNRAIADELDRKGLQLPFDLRDDLKVEWAGHPNWYFRLSKLSLPYLNHPAVPRAVFLDDWLAQPESGLPHDRNELLLKPLYSFAGKGIQFAPTDADIAAIPVAERRNYLMQERMAFAPLIDTPHGLTQAEVRILYLWPDGGVLEPVTSLVRLGRGQMMGVDHNRNQQWVGGSAALLPRSHKNRHTERAEVR